MSKITKFARGRDCTIRLPGVCNFNPETSVWCHGRSMAEGKGLGMKVRDIHGAIGCSACHEFVDRNGKSNPPEGMTWQDVDLAFYEGKARSLNQLIDAKLVVVVE